MEKVDYFAFYHNHKPSSQARLKDFEGYPIHTRLATEKMWDVPVVGDWMHEYFESRELGASALLDEDKGHFS